MLINIISILILLSYCQYSKIISNKAKDKIIVEILTSEDYTKVNHNIIQIDNVENLLQDITTNEHAY